MNKLLILGVLLVIVHASNSAPLEDELDAFQQYQDAVGNKNLAAVEQGFRDMIGDSLREGFRKVGSNFCKQIEKMPQETEQVFIESIDNKLQAMEEEEDMEDIAAMQFLGNIRQWFKDNGRNVFQEFGKAICKRLPKSFEDALVQNEFDSQYNTINEVELQGRRQKQDGGQGGKFFTRLGNAARDVARKTFCNRNKDTRAQEEALAQYIDNQLEMMQEGEEGEAQFLKKIWKKAKRFFKPIIKRHFCASIEVMDDDDKIEDKALQSVVQSWLDVTQK